MTISSWISSCTTAWVTRHCRSVGPGVVVLRGARIDSGTELGAFSYVGRWTVITSSLIGRYCSIADRVTIGPGEHELHAGSTHSIFYDDPGAVLLSRPAVNIGPDVWVGVNAVIRRGVLVGAGAVIGANAFVNADVPPYAIVVGTPAKVIGYRFSESLQQVLLASRWFDHPPQEAKRILTELASHHPELVCV